MFIRNKKSGLVQECLNEDVIRVCKKDVEHYEVSKDKPQISKEEKIEPPAEQSKNLEDMTVPELKALAKEKGIDGANSLNKEDLLSAIKEVE